MKKKQKKLQIKTKKLLVKSGKNISKICIENFLKSQINEL